VPRRPALTALVALAAGGSAAAVAAAPPPAYETPQEAIAAIKRVLRKSQVACATDWARIDATGYQGAWTIDVRIRASDAGKGVARWRIGKGWPTAANPLAKALAKSCPAPPKAST
jgi:hypothetical protein